MHTLERGKVRLLVKGSLFQLEKVDNVDDLLRVIRILITTLFISRRVGTNV